MTAIASFPSWHQVLPAPLTLPFLECARPASIPSSTRSPPAPVPTTKIQHVLPYSYRAADRVTWYENTDEAGTFAVGLEISTTTDAGISLAAADLDSDGDLDILVASYYDNRVTWYNNSDGNGAFSLGVDITLGAEGPT